MSSNVKFVLRKSRVVHRLLVKLSGKGFMFQSADRMLQGTDRMRQG